MFNAKFATQSSVQSAIPSSAQASALPADDSAGIAAAGRINAHLSEFMRAADIRLLYQLASDYDAISPNVAARLRDIAGRH